MTVAEARALLATLPDDALLCFTTGDRKETILEATELRLRLVDVTGGHDGYYAAISTRLAIARWQWSLDWESCSSSP